jgi:hypothetical protein
MSTIDAKTRKTLRGIIRGKIDPMTFETVARWVDKLYNPPDKVELQLMACNEVLGGYGIEPVNGAWVSPFYQNCTMLYVNMGDAYDQTVVYNCVKGTFHLTSWGDMVEHAQKYYGVQ